MDNLDLEKAEFTVKTLQNGNWLEAAGMMSAMISEIRRLYSRPVASEGSAEVGQGHRAATVGGVGLEARRVHNALYFEESMTDKSGPALASLDPLTRLAALGHFITLAAEVRRLQAAALPVEEPLPVDGERVDLRLAGAVFNSFSSRPEIKRHGDAVIAECRRLRQEIDRLRPEGEEQGPRPVEDVPLVYGDTIQAGDECWAAGRGPWMPVGDEREGESFYPWNGNSGIHPPMRRPAASRPLEEGKAVDPDAGKELALYLLAQIPTPHTEEIEVTEELMHLICAANGGTFDTPKAEEGKAVDRG